MISTLSPASAIAKRNWLVEGYILLLIYCVLTTLTFTRPYFRRKVLPCLKKEENTPKNLKQAETLNPFAFLHIFHIFRQFK